MAQTPLDMAAAVDRIAAGQMGVDPQQMQPAPAAPAEPKDSAQDKAAEKGSPETEADKMADAAVIYEVEFGENDNRRLTPQQIKSTFERYSAMNYKNAQMKPVNDVIEGLMAANPGMSPAQLAEQMTAVIRAQESNPTMGNTQGEQQQKPGNPNDLDSALSAWAEENAVALPPGYKEMLVGNMNNANSMQRQMAQLQAMMQQIMAGSQGVADAARDQVTNANNQRVSAIRQQIANNIDRAQAAAQLPDDAANDFMVFAAERGYTFEDFVDPGLTLKVVDDFKNTMNSPEMDRLRSIANRRQAWTGSLGGSTPAAPGTEPAPENATFDRISQSIMSQRGLG